MSLVRFAVQHLVLRTLVCRNCCLCACVHWGRRLGSCPTCFPEPLVTMIHTNSPLTLNTFLHQEPMIFHKDGKEISAPAVSKPLINPVALGAFLKSKWGCTL